MAGAPVALLLRARPRWQAGWALGVMVTALTTSLLLLAQVWRGGEDGYLPSRTSVVMFSNRHIDRHLRPASTQMANRFHAALDSRRAEVEV